MCRMWVVWFFTDLRYILAILWPILSTFRALLMYSFQGGIGDMLPISSKTAAELHSKFLSWILFRNEKWKNFNGPCLQITEHKDLINNLSWIKWNLAAHDYQIHGFARKADISLNAGFATNAGWLVSKFKCGTNQPEVGIFGHGLLGYEGIINQTREIK